MLAPEESGDSYATSEDLCENIENRVGEIRKAVEQLNGIVERFPTTNGEVAKIAARQEKLCLGQLKLLEGLVDKRGEATG